MRKLICPSVGGTGNTKSSAGFNVIVVVLFQIAVGREQCKWSRIVAISRDRLHHSRKQVLERSRQRQQLRPDYSGSDSGLERADSRQQRWLGGQH